MLRADAGAGRDLRVAPERPAPAQPRWHPVAARAAWWLLVTAGIGTVLGWVGSWWWAFDLLSHFRVQYAVALLIAAGLALASRRRAVAILALGLALGNGALVVPRYVAAEAPVGAPAAPALKVLLANLNSGNADHESVITLVRALDPDLFVGLEITPSWAAALDAALDALPAREVVARSDNFGIGIYSRTPLAAVAVEDLAGDDRPTLVARIEHAGEPVWLIATHPTPPLGGALAALRDAHLLHLARRWRELDGHVVVVGDLNTTPWSHAFGDLLASGLRDTGDGHGVQATWPTTVPPLLVPLDHVLTSPGLVAVERRRGPDIGSDHYPVFATLRIVGPWRAATDPAQPTPSSR